MRVTSAITEKVTKFNAEPVDIALRNMKITKSKVSTLVLGRDASYVSNALTNGKCNKEDLKKLCDFCSLEYDAIIITENTMPNTTDTLKNPSDVINLDALILGINQLYQIEKSNNDTMKEILEQIKVSNTKASRLENLIGQMHANLISVKENTKEIENVQRETKSSVSTISGRLKDMLNKFKG